MSSSLLLFRSKRIAIAVLTGNYDNCYRFYKCQIKSWIHIDVEASQQYSKESSTHLNSTDSRANEFSLRTLVPNSGHTLVHSVDTTINLDVYLADMA